ncbi:serine protein kinase RIO [Auraticoccus monumenti]|uniref:non-specific serine/threonine protein kinase n=1 Tax=Auraticoccus monumenti TaxID=675864 RepID=A0A1G7BLP3_9ACTN|nr:RIO1 family regulatory kinase/ATPase [Auraticoccus monumenti]SDE28051.1 RIO kinase 1 [Auraticoccus monumenti]
MPPSDWSFDDLTFTSTTEPGPGQRWSTWSSVQAGRRGPEPRPPWVVTADAALDTDLGAVKSGKEADCFLLERAVPGDPTRSALMIGKRYRDAENRLFHRNATYTEGRRTRNSRDARATARGTAYGREVSAGQWAAAEWAGLVRLWQLGVPVPYPVQLDGTELLMELVADDDGQVAPRLAATRPAPALLASLWEQLEQAMTTMTRAGLVHGDLSPYNLLLAGERLVVIDVPQLVDLVANPQGAELLHRDCRNVTSWFARRGHGDADAAEELFARLLAVAW